MIMNEIKPEEGFQNKIYAFIKMALRNQISRVFIGAVFGALIGILYWEFIGCNGGSCPLTSSPTKTIVVFTIMGMWFNFRK
jgi:hypothetical protein